MTTVDIALMKIKEIKKQETKIRELYAEKYNQLSEEQRAVLNSLGLDFSGLQDLYIVLHQMREFCERNLGNKEIECDWC